MLEGRLVGAISSSYPQGVVPSVIQLKRFWCEAIEPWAEFVSSPDWWFFDGAIVAQRSTSSAADNLEYSK
ncbi:hypothetical protein [Phormidesmis priestleyi]